MESILIIGGAILAGLITLAIIFKMVWRVAEANEALIVSGLAAHDKGSVDGLDFKIVVGRGTLVLPGFQTVRRLNLDVRTTKLPVSCVSGQGIPVQVTGVVAYKIGDDRASIANAARRFLDQQGEIMQSAIHELFAGHLRAAVGGVTVEEMLHDRETLTSAVRNTLETDLQRLGLVVDSLQLQEIDDTVGYIDSLGRPDAAAVAARARIAEAQRDKEATEAEQAAAAEKAAFIRDSEVKQAEAQAIVDAERAKAAQAGPLSDAVARQEVVQAETLTAEMLAARTEKELESQVRKPADAKAYEMRTIADAEAAAKLAAARAEAEATQVTGLAEAEATKAQALAEAAGIKARAEALATESEAVIAQQIAEKYPEIVAAAASSFEKVGNMVVLNGADGMEDMLGKVLTMGGAGFGVAKALVQDLATSKDEKQEKLAPAPAKGTRKSSAVPKPKVAVDPSSIPVMNGTPKAGSNGSPDGSPERIRPED